MKTNIKYAADKKKPGIKPGTKFSAKWKRNISKGVSGLPKTEMQREAMSYAHSKFQREVHKLMNETGLSYSVARKTVSISRAASRK